MLMSNILNLETVPDSIQLNLAVGSLIFHLGTGDWLTETKEGQCQVDETILVLLKIILAINDLVQLQNNQASHQRSGCGNGRNDLASNELGLVSISWLNLVVLGPQVAASSDEIDVMVRVIVLLEIDRNELESRQRAGGRQTVSQLLDLVVVVEARLRLLGIC
ncbi:unnamed protein product [Fusarium graminearum]|nr:unnamed protein product [Fusarium graminearum]CAG1989184.1 unnamed protein product [Fusarium graminearum]VTO88369.1 unnamed protein product [Fusarium graminearum]